MPVYLINLKPQNVQPVVPLVSVGFSYIINIIDPQVYTNTNIYNFISLF